MKEIKLKTKSELDSMRLDELENYRIELVFHNGSTVTKDEYLNNTKVYLEELRLYILVRFPDELNKKVRDIFPHESEDEFKSLCEMVLDNEMKFLSPMKFIKIDNNTPHGDARNVVDVSDLPRDKADSTIEKQNEFYHFM